MKKILLVGNPNVGKSALFSRLTGVRVFVSNYPGTTVEYTEGYMRLNGERVQVIDVPGCYGMESAVKAEQVAVEMIKAAAKNEDAIILNIVDSSNLERNLNLTLHLIHLKLPMLIALNFWDEAGHIGVKIEPEKLEKILGVPVIPTSAITGEGVLNLVEKLPDARQSSYECSDKDQWVHIGKIVEDVQDLSHRHHTFGETLGDISVHPIGGIPIMLLVLATSFYIIRSIGESLIGYVLDPLFEIIWTPLMLKLHSLLHFSSILQDILIGPLSEGGIEYVESLGLLTTGLYVPLAMVLPYIFSFYLVLSFLEDSGYLPRLGVMMDSLMHKVGIHGLAIIPMLLGVGCNVPGAMSTRILETRREKFIAATLMAIAIPCMAQVAMIFGLVGHYGTKAIALVFGILFLVWLALGMLMHRFVKGESPEIFVEIPPYRIPYFNALMKKMAMRVSSYLKEAVPFVLLGVLLVNILYSLNIIQMIAKVTAPVVTGIMGLPGETVGALVIGFLRKDVAVGMLLPLGLTFKEMVIASVALTMYFPCIATFAVMVKELGLKDMSLAAGIMLLSTILTAGLLNFIL
ncbi:MAG TPA: ferrous iron transporter B [Candidatus Marinimicrobia bacterium]|nr:ferrous iron transporter B [Candidatus Neomarinimicrobiota bacterium]